MLFSDFYLLYLISALLLASSVKIAMNETSQVYVTYRFRRR